MQHDSTTATNAASRGGSELSEGLGPLPEPDTHCWDDDTERDVWSHSEDQLRAYAAQEVAAERERLRGLVDTARDDAAREGSPEAAHWLADLARKLAA